MEQDEKILIKNLSNQLDSEKVDKIIQILLLKLKNVKKIHSIILYGSYNKNSFIEGWSDIDLMVVLKRPLSIDEFSDMSKIINELQSTQNILLSVNTLLISEVQIPTFGKPLIYINELKDGKLIYGDYNPFKNCLI